jgi:hypothetical protein
LFIYFIGAKNQPKFLKEKCMKIILLAVLVMSLKAAAQQEEEKVKTPIINLFEGMRKSDSNMLRAAFAPGAILQTVVKNKEGKVVVRSEEVNKFIEAITKPRTEIYDERVTFDIVRIDNDLAIAWTPYKFYISEKFSHCGVNSFQLVRINGEWKIQYLIDTRRREGCE